MLWDIKRFYKDEFYIGQKAVEMIAQRTKIILPEDEAGFIALHFVNAQMEENPDKVEDMYTITKVMQELSNIVKYYFNMEYDEDSVYYYRFVTHLKFFAQRLVTKKTYQEESEDDLLDIIKMKYKNAYECVKVIKKFLVEQYDYLLSDEEMLYLTIHIARVTNKNCG